MRIILKVPPRLAFRMHAEDENCGAGLTCACTVKRLEGNMANRPEWWVRQALAFNQDLGFPGEVIVEFFAGMPMPIKRCVGRYFHKVHQHLTSRSETFVERMMQEICHPGLGAI